MEDLFYNKYLKEERLGRGASSEVWRVVDQQTGVTQAIKIYNPAVAIEDDGIEMLKHEFALMANINHQNLLRPLYFGISGNNPFLVLPYCKNGNLKKKVGQFTNEDGWRLLRDVASGLAYLHKQVPPIIHQDIKPENILIGDDGSYMLTDFGVSAHARNTTRATISTTLTSAGTMAYMAPEKFSSDKTLIIASDIWSLGAMTFEMLSGEVPFSVGTIEGGVLQKNGADIPVLPETVEPALREIIYRCLSLEPWDRPKAAEIEAFADRALHCETPTVITPFIEKGKENINKPWYKKPLTIAACIAATVGIIVLNWKEPEPIPEPLTLEERYAKAEDMLKDSTTIKQGYELMLEIAEEMLKDSTTMKQGCKLSLEIAVKMLKDSVNAKQGFEHVKKLSNVYHYERATFLWSRLLFRSANNNDYENEEYGKMRSYADIEIDNREAHRLLKKAVEEDTAKNNHESRYELALDYFYAGHRDSSYRIFLTKENFSHAIELLDTAIKAADDNSVKSIYGGLKNQIKERLDRDKIR